MTSVTYFICGVRVKAPTRLEIRLRGDAPGPMPALQHLAPAGREQVSAGADGQWVLMLEPGDHVVHVAHEEWEADTWPGVALALSPSGVLVTCRTKGGLLAWQAEAGGSDPKDPWPPPGKAETLDDVQWFQQAFGSLQVVIPKGD